MNSYYGTVQKRKLGSGRGWELIQSFQDPETIPGWAYKGRK